LEQVGVGLEKLVLGSLQRVPQGETPLLARPLVEASDAESGASLSCCAEPLRRSESGEDRVCDSAGMIGQENEMNCGNPHVRL